MLQVLTWRVVKNTEVAPPSHSLQSSIFILEILNMWHLSKIILETQFYPF